MLACTLSIVQAVFFVFTGEIIVQRPAGIDEQQQMLIMFSLA